jgi:hypothetical protein
VENKYLHSKKFADKKLKCNGKTAKKKENGTKGLKYAKSVFFPDSRNDSKKKKVLQQSSKISIFFLEQLLGFGCFWPEKGVHLQT